ncbi:hypothetical protein BUALT_Bualt12G0096900 [Buddleja alternifolia]|uniref:Pentatricopeptide repeat-containing protein n=1 Tax=Buddleja alternifolia TaxID=168488 RepID=A0AAV6WRK8_9LAMI|nr:hypothetical protein BUALT_Bualt12G0096900 [Buddleja alternifolia]
MYWSVAPSVLTRRLPNIAFERNYPGMLSTFEASQAHAKILKLGLQNNPLVLTKFTSISSRLNVVHYACSFIFSEYSNPHCYDTFLFDTVIKVYAETTNYKHCAGIGELNWGKMVHGLVSKLGFGDDTHVGNSMVHMYCSCGDGIGFAEKVFDEMCNQNLVSWSTMIGGCVRWGMSSEVVRLFRSMQIDGVRPDEITQVMVLSACADLGALELGRWVESYIKREIVEWGLSYAMR